MYAFWNGILMPISIVMTYYGWIQYRFRETRAMSAGQFFEMRYSKGLRRLVAVLRGSADLLANYAGTAHEVRSDLAARVTEELVADAGAADAVRAAVSALPEQRHEIGVDPPLSQANNLETPTLDAAHGALLASLPEAEANAAYQGFRATYRQQTLPIVLRHVAPPWILSLVAILVQRNWAASVYPWLAAHGWDAGVRHALEVLSSPFAPWVDWRVSDALWPVRFPVNSIEISFVVVLVVPLVINAFTTVWFAWGTYRDLRQLFRDLATRKRDDLDNGMVEGHVSLAESTTSTPR